MRDPREAERRAFLKAAQQAVSGLDKSTCMVGLFDDQVNRPERWEFALQIGHCLLTGKPLILIVPEGVVLPDKLHEVATLVERYRVGDLASMKLATERALTTLGAIKVQ